MSSKKAIINHLHTNSKVIFLKMFLITTNYLILTTFYNKVTNCHKNQISKIDKIFTDNFFKVIPNYKIEVFQLTIFVIVNIEFL